MSSNPIPATKRPTTRRKVLAAGVVALVVPLVATNEGLRQETYLDTRDVPTICFGYTHGVKLGDYKTLEECQALLVQELEVANGYVDSCLRGGIPDGPRAAFVSLVYNVGPSAVCSDKSSIKREWNSGRFKQACEAINKYVYSAGKKLRGLVRRRKEESTMCLTGI